MGLDQLEDAKKCYESLRTFGENTIADSYLKKLAGAQERDKYFSIQFDPKTERLQMILDSRSEPDFRLQIFDKNYLSSSPRNSTIRVQNRNR